MAKGKRSSSIRIYHATFCNSLGKLLFLQLMTDIRAITRLVPPGGNLVQGQSELPIDPQLAAEAAAIIAASKNHYGGSEGDDSLRKAVTAKIAKYNGIDLDVNARPFEVIITNG